MKFLILVFLAAGVSSIPLLNDTNAVTAPRWFLGLSPEDYAFIQTLPRGRVGAQIPGFLYLYVTHSGGIFLDSGSTGQSIEIAGSPRTTYDARYYAASVVASMVKATPNSIFQKLSVSASVGVFTAAEKLTIFPQYAYLANTASCGSSCAGSCSVSCTFDGRKYEDLAGSGGQRAVVLDDNVVCNSNDPYRGSHNILSHEFSHTIHAYGLDTATKNQITNAYQSAKQSSTWALSSYAMANEQEYFAEGASVFFGVNKDQSSGGMNQCGNTICTETPGREHLRIYDNKLYNVLSYVFTDNRPSLASGLKVCPNGYPSTIVG